MKELKEGVVGGKGTILEIDAEIEFVVGGAPDVPPPYSGPVASLEDEPRWYVPPQPYPIQSY